MGYYLTETAIEDDVKLLNLCGCRNPLLMFKKLFDCGIDILNNNYRIYTSDGQPTFEILKNAVKYNLAIEIEPEDRDVKKISDNTKLITHHLTDFKYPFTLLGQLLTDYDNGREFKKVLVAMKLDGYIFDETLDANTICLLNSEKLSPPQYEFINNQELFLF